MEKDFSKISPKLFKKIILVVSAIFFIVFVLICFEVYVPLNPGSQETILYTAERGMGDDEIGVELQNLGITRNNYFFRLYVIVTMRHGDLKAGDYSLSSKMSIAQIAKKMAQGDVIKSEIIILEGWDIRDIGKYLESKNICEQNYFIALTQKDYSNKFNFLLDKPKNTGLEGYLFPDTYQISKGETCENILNYMLVNFDKKINPELRENIAKQGKTIFDIVTMASLLEKEVRTIEDKKIVAGILWKRLSVGMPLQLDATVNYITGKKDPSVTIKDTKIDSPYNTYKYKGLPKGPISNSGIESIIATINPKKTNYWYYLTDGGGKTIFSENLQQHNIARAKM